MGKTISYYRKKADKQFQQSFCKDKRCEMCGGELSCGHHVFPKSACSALRYEPENMVGVCAGCHLKFHSKFASEMIIRLTLMRGQEWYDRLKAKKNQLIKVNKAYYETILED